MNLAILDFEYYDGIIWFVDVLAGCLWKKNIKNGNLEIVVELPRINVKEQYRALCLRNSKLYIAPLFAEKLIIYDIEQHTTNNINLEEVVVNDKPNYVEMIPYGKFIFCIPMSSTKILRINTEDDSIDVYEYEIFREKLERPFFRKAGVHRNFIFMGLCNEAKIIRFDMEKLTYEMIDLSFLSTDGFSSCNCTANEIILVSFDNSKVYVIDYSYQLLKEYDLNASIVFANYIVIGNEFFCIDCNGKGEGILINLGNKTIEPFSLEVGKKSEIETRFGLNGFSLAGKAINSELWIFITNECTLNRFTKAGKLIEKICFDVSNDDSKIVNRKMGDNLKREFDSNGNGIVEDKYINIETFIHSLL